MMEIIEWYNSWAIRNELFANAILCVKYSHGSPFFLRCSRQLIAILIIVDFMSMTNGVIQMPTYESPVIVAYNFFLLMSH